MAMEVSHIFVEPDRHIFWLMVNYCKILTILANCVATTKNTCLDVYLCVALLTDALLCDRIQVAVISENLGPVVI